MGKILVIAEKPSVARDITAALGGFTDHEGEYYESDRYVVTFALGHLLELAAPEDYDPALRGWTIDKLPIIPELFKVKPREGQKKRVDLIRKLGMRADVESLINACDAGREGEVIFRRIIEYTELDRKPHQRLWLQSMTTDAIRHGFASLRPGTELDHLADAAWLRSVGDWLIGMNATRALTRRLKGRKEKGVWSAGRVQTPTLGLLVLREREVHAHEPATYWEIEASFEGAGHAWLGRYHDPSVADAEDRDQRPNRIFDRARVDAVVTAVRAAGVGVASEKRRKSRQSPPLPFDLTTLQREANRRFSFSAKRTLDAAQRLYEAHKVLTYPRTDSRHLPGDYLATVQQIIGALTADADFTTVATRIQSEGLQNVEIVLDSSKVSDHFAIVPTGAVPPTTMSPDDSRIYELVCRQFLASFMGPATWATVERLVELPVPDAAPAVFRTTARALEVPGFLEALGMEEGKGTELPPLVPGSDTATGVEALVERVEDEEKQTKPPARLTEAALLRLMETAGERMEDEGLLDAMKGRGLGTPATRAETIERLISTAYAIRVEGKLAPTPKGMRLMDILDRARVPVLASARLTGEWEFQLKQVEAGTIQRAQSLDGLVSFTREMTAALAKFDYDALYASEPSLGRCPSCGLGDVIETVWGYRCSRNVREDDSPCRLFLWKERSGRYVDRKLAETLVRDRRCDRVIGFVDRFGRALEGRIILDPESPEPGAQWNMRVEYGDQAEGSGAEAVGGVVFPCPCGAEDCGGVVETNQRYVCQRVLEGRAKAGPVLPRVVCSRNIEVEEAQAYFGAEGGTAFLENFISRRGRPFKGRLVRRESGRHAFEFPERPEGARRGKKPLAEGEEAPVKKARKVASEDAPPKRTRKAAEAVEGEEAPAPKRARKAVAEGDAPATPKRTKKIEDGEAAPKRTKKAADGEAAPKRTKKAADGEAAPAKATPKRASAKKPPPPPPPPPPRSNKPSRNKPSKKIRKSAAALEGDEG